MDTTTNYPTHDMTSHDVTSHDMTSHDMTSHDMTSHDMTSHDMDFTSTILEMNTTMMTSSSTKDCKWSSFNTILAFGCFLTLLINGLASIILFRVPLVNIRGRSNPVYLCIRFMNICDIAQAFLMLIMPLFAHEDCSFIGGFYICNCFGFLALFLLIISPLITILMAFDRVLALYQPFLYRSHIGMKVLKIALQISVVIVFILALLPIFQIGEYHVVEGRRVCLIDTITNDRNGAAYVLAIHSLFVIALGLLLGCTISFQFKLIQLECQKQKQRRKNSSKRTRNATMTTMMICVIFICCYSPYIIRVLKEASTNIKSSKSFTYITFALAFLQPLINPIVCLIANARYRKELMIVLHKLGTGGEIDTTTDSQTTTNNHRSTFNVHTIRRHFQSSHRKSSIKKTNSQHNGESIKRKMTSSLRSSNVGGIQLRTIYNQSRDVINGSRDVTEQEEKRRTSTKTSILVTSPFKVCNNPDDDDVIDDDVFTPPQPTQHPLLVHDDDVTV